MFSLKKKALKQIGGQSWNVSLKNLVIKVYPQSISQLNLLFSFLHYSFYCICLLFSYNFGF